MEQTNQKTGMELEMNAQNQMELKEMRSEAPLFASPWVALFLVLRKEFTQSRPAR